MSTLRARITAVAIVASLGGLATVALVQRSDGPSGDRSASNPPVDVRTEIIRRTRRVMRRPDSPRSGQADGNRARSLTATQPSAPSTALTTRGSGSVGAEYEDERDDDDEEYEESEDEESERERYEDESGEHERPEDDGRREEDD